MSALSRSTATESHHDELLRLIMEAPTQRPLNATWNTFVTIAAREVTRFLHDPTQLVFALFMPILLILGLDGPLQSSFGKAAGYNLMGFAITGMLALSFYQHTLI